MHQAVLIKSRTRPTDLAHPRHPLHRLGERQTPRALPASQVAVTGISAVRHRRGNVRVQTIYGHNLDFISGVSVGAMQVPIIGVASNGRRLVVRVPVDGLVVTSLTPLVLYSNPPWLAQGVTYVFGPENIRPISFSTYKSNPLCSPGEVPLCETSTGQPCNPWTGGNCICKCGPGQLASASSQADKRSRQAMMRGLRSRDVNPGGTCYAGYAHGHECKGQ